MAGTWVNFGKSTTVSGRTLGGASLALAAGTGVKFGAPTPQDPMRLTIYRPVEGADQVQVTILECTDVSGDVLTISGTSDGEADAVALPGDYVVNSATAGDFRDLWTAVENVESTPGPQGDPGPAGVGSFGLSMPGGFSVANSPLTESGVISVTTDLSGVIKGAGGAFVEVVPGVDYVTPSALSSKADDSGVVHLAGAETIAGAKTFTSTIVGSVSGNAASLSTPLGTSKGGTGLTSLGAAGQVLTVNAGATALEWQTPSGGGGSSFDPSADQTITGKWSFKSDGADPCRTLQNSVGATVGEIDQDGYGFPVTAVFSLADGFDLAVGDDLTNGGFVARKPGKITDLAIQAKTNGASGGFTLGIKRNGTTIFTTAPSVAASTTTVQSFSAFSNAAVGVNDVFTISCTSTGTAVQFVKVFFSYNARNL